MADETLYGRPHTSLEQDLLKLFLANQAGAGSTESNNHAAHTRLCEELGRLAGQGQEITVYGLRGDDMPIKTVNKDQVVASADQADAYATRWGYIMRGPAREGKLGIALSTRQAKEVSAVPKGMHYIVDVTDADKLNIGIILH